MKIIFTYLLALGLVLSTATAHSQETIDKLSIDPGISYQTIEGFGAALAYYEGWVNAHPKKGEIYEAIFGELSLDILRVRNAYVYDPDMIGRVKEYMVAAEASLGHPIKLLSSSWAPTDTLKNTGDRKNGGTLRYEIVDGKVVFDYEGFAQWWDGALDEYETNGVLPDYISLQNEPDWSADYESCLFRPSEVITSTDTIASYSKALDAIYNMVQAREKKPLILGPETVGIGYNSVQNYVNALDVSKLDGIAHHLYHGVNEDYPYSSNEFANLGSFHPEVPHFQTEYSRGDWFSLAGLIYKSFYDEKVEAYLYWDLVWPDGGLVSIKNPWQNSTYTKTKDFYSFKQFSAFIHPGWKMVGHSMSSDKSASLTFMSPGLDSAACVIINRSVTADITVQMEIPGYRIHQSAIYTTSDSENCLLKGALLDSTLTVGAHSITTIDMRIMPYDPADDTEAPSVPTGLQIAEVIDTSMVLKWNSSSDNIGVEGYHVFLDGSFYGGTADTFITLTGLEPLTDYEMTVSAFDHVPNESARSAAVTGGTIFLDREAPSTPSGVQITGITEFTLTLEWNASTDNVGVEGYNIYLDGSAHGVTAGTFVTLTGLEALTSYDVSISAYDLMFNESTLSVEVTGTTLYFDREAPVVEASDSIWQEGTVEVSSSEEGIIYLVPGETPGDLDLIRAATIDSTELMANIPEDFFVSGLPNGEYWFYATDSALNISEPAKMGVYGVGVSNFELDMLRLYPNPLSESAILEFSLTANQPTWIAVHDSQGRELSRKFLGHLSEGPNQCILLGTGLAEGIYFFRLVNPKGEGISGRFVIRN